MRKRWWVIANVFVLVIVVLALALMVWNFSFGEVDVPIEECIEVNRVSSFGVDACYDAYSKRIFLKVQRGHDDYKVNSLNFMFFDFSEKFYEITDVPEMNGVKAYKISAEKNPQKLEMTLSIVKDFSAPICNGSRKFFVKYCPVGIRENGIDVSMSPLRGVGLEDFVDIGQASIEQDSDVFVLSLAEKEGVWMSQCESRWKCKEWEECVDSIQRRECKDLKNCFVSTEVPATVRYCDGGCSENWECEWSECRGGWTIPKCKDLNDCGTLYNIPQKLECEIDGLCIPDIRCEEWGNCEIDYNFMNLVKGDISELKGVRSRVCVDRNSCVDLRKESEDCLFGVDIYTQRFKKCGDSFIGIYNRLNGDLIAKVREGGEDSRLDIYFVAKENEKYCDYCFDGVMNGDEEGVDCGGSCESCADRYKMVEFEQVGWWGDFLEWAKNIV